MSLAPSPGIAAFVTGFLSCGYVLAGVFFLRFWTKTRDALFAVFAAAFWLMAANQALPILLDLPADEQSGAYLLRAAAFVLISIGVLSKNLGSGRRP